MMGGASDRGWRDVLELVGAARGDDGGEREQRAEVKVIAVRVREHDGVDRTDIGGAKR